MKQPMKHTVRRGESLYKIAQHHGTTVNRLLRKNPQITDPNLIYPGERIRVH